MTAVYQYVEGAVTSGATNSRTISSIVGNVITIGTEFGSVPAIGRTLEIISNTGDALNNQLYVATNVPVAGGGSNGVRTYTVRPTPTAGGTLGSLRQRVVTNSITLAASTITSIVDLGGSRALLTIAGADFRSAEVHVGDRVVVTGSAAANNGAWYVLAVLSDTELILVPPDGGAGMVASVVGTISARRGSLTIAYSNQAALSWTDLHDTCTPYTGPGGSFRGPGSMPDFLKKSQVGGGSLVDAASQRTAFDLYGITLITIDQTSLGAPSFWNMVNEVIVNRAQTAAAGSLSCRIIMPSFASWGTGNFLTFNLGEQNGNRYSAENGTALIGVGVIVAGPENRMQPFGSYVDAANMAVTMGPGNGACSVVRPTLTTGTGTTESMVGYGEFGLVVEGVGDQANVTIASQTATASFAAAATVSGLLISDIVPTPLSIAAIGDVTIRNPRVNFDLADVYTGVGAAGTFIKTYSYEPVITHFDENTGVIEFVEGRRIHIFEIDLTNGGEVEVYDGVTGVGGTLTTACPDLRVQQTTGNVISDYFAHRFEQSGGGLQDQIITTIITSPIVGDTIPAYDDTRIWTRRVTS